MKDAAKISKLYTRSKAKKCEWLSKVRDTNSKVNSQHGQQESVAWLAVGTVGTLGITTTQPPPTTALQEQGLRVTSVPHFQENQEPEVLSNFPNF